MTRGQRPALCRASVSNATGQETTFGPASAEPLIEIDSTNRTGDSGKVSADGQQVAGDTRQESMREPRHGEPARDFPCVTAFAQPMQQAIDPTDIELLAHAECRRGEPLELAAG